MTETDALIVGVTKREVFLRLPDLHPSRIVTIPGASKRLRAVGKGESVRVLVTGGIVASPSGWWADVTLKEEGQ